MNKKDDVRSFLISRRANITPAQAGLPDFGTERRVPGLRREEVAELAGVSLDYYTRLERGNIDGASDSVLNAIARALRLSDVERDHLIALARAAPRITKPVSMPHAPALRNSVQRVLDNLTVPAVVYDARQNLIACNLLGRALFFMIFENEPPNMARFIFLDSRAREFYVDWRRACSLTAAMLRFEAGRDPLDAGITELVGELATRSPQFREDWSAHDVHEHRTGRKLFHHPQVGEVDLTFDVFEMPGQPGLFITTYTADKESGTAEKLTLLASWAAASEPGSGEAYRDFSGE